MKAPTNRGMGAKAVASLRAQAGVSLIEVLVSLLVISVGLLGLAALQGQSIRFTSDSHTRDQATMLAVDLADRIRARPATMNSYFNGKDLPAIYAALVADDKSKWATDCGDDTKRANNPKCCDPKGTTIDDDLRCWMWQAKSTLGTAPAPTIAANGTDSSRVDITLKWFDREPREFADGVRLPNDQTECEAAARREWNAASKQCLITQVWTVRP